MQAGLALGLNGIFIRDFKQYDLETGIMGVSVSTGIIDTLVNHFGHQEFGDACEKFTLDRKLGLFVMMAIQASDDGSIKKNICIFSTPKNNSGSDLQHRVQSLKSLIEGTEDMQLHDKKEMSS